MEFLLRLLTSPLLLVAAIFGALFAYVSPAQGPSEELS